MHDANTTREVPLVPDTLFYGIKSNGELLAASIGLSRWGLSNCNIFSSFRLWRCCTRASSARLSTVLRLDGWAAAFAAMPPGPRADWCAGREAMKPKPRADDAGRKPWLMARCHPLSRAGSAAANSALPMAASKPSRLPKSGKPSEAYWSAAGWSVGTYVVGRMLRVKPGLQFFDFGHFPGFPRTGRTAVPWACGHTASAIGPQP